MDVNVVAIAVGVSVTKVEWHVLAAARVSTVEIPTLRKSLPIQKMKIIPRKMVKIIKNTSIMTINDFNIFFMYIPHQRH